MELVDAIKHVEEVAETQEEKCKHAGHDHYTKLEASACAAEHRQLAEWLKELREVYAMLEGCADTDELFVGYIRKRMKGGV